MCHLLQNERRQLRDTKFLQELISLQRLNNVELHQAEGRQQLRWRKRLAGRGGQWTWHDWGKARQTTNRLTFGCRFQYLRWHSNTWYVTKLFSNPVYLFGLRCFCVWKYHLCRVVSSFTRAWLCITKFGILATHLRCSATTIFLVALGWWSFGSQGCWSDSISDTWSRTRKWQFGNCQGHRVFFGGGLLFLI